MLFYVLFLVYYPLRICTQEVKAKINQKLPDFVPTGPSMEVTPIEVI